MIQLVRIDDRLLHGQVAYSWKAELGYQAIVIASDKAANDNLRKVAMKMAKPDNVLLAIRTIRESISLLTNPKLSNLKVFVVTDTVEGANQILRSLTTTTLLNIGGLQKEDDKKSVTSFAYMSEKEIKILQSLEQDGYKIEFRLVPSDTPKNLKNINK
jgi:fructoselysine/glucoselysine PTS system EIIB component